MGIHWYYNSLLQRKSESLVAIQGPIINTNTRKTVAKTSFFNNVPYVVLRSLLMTKGTLSFHDAACNNNNNNNNNDEMDVVSLNDAVAYAHCPIVDNKLQQQQQQQQQQQDKDRVDGTQDHCRQHRGERKVQDGTIVNGNGT
jgi:hypothetical protein